MSTLPATGPISALRVAVENVTNYGGRATRGEYWWLFLAMMGVTFVATFVVEWLFLFGVLSASLADLADVGVFIASAAIVLPTAVRRLHDSGQSGFWVVIPIVNLVMLLMPSDPAVNRFGPPRSF